MAEKKKPSDYKGLSKEEAIRQFKRDANAYKRSFGDTPERKRMDAAERKLADKGVNSSDYSTSGAKHTEALKSRDPDIAEYAKANSAWHDSIPENASANALKEAHGVTDKEIRKLRFEAEEPDFNPDAPAAAPAGQSVPQGMIQQGNIDLNTRPVVKNQDGTVSTVRSIGINVNGREVLIPTVSEDGRVMSNAEAVDTFKKTGRHLGMFGSEQDATRYAKQLHEQQAGQLDPSGAVQPKPQYVAAPAAATAAAPAAAAQSGQKSGPVADILRRSGGGAQVPADAPGVADFMAGIRGIVKPEMDAAAAAKHAALVDAARNQGFDQGKKWVQDAADQKKQADAAGKKPPVFLSAQQLARYNNSVKWAAAGMSPAQIAEKHAKTTYSQPGNVAADISGLPATFLEDNNFTLTPPAQKGAMGGMSTEEQWNKLFPNRAGTPEMPNPGAKAPAEPNKPGAQLMGTVMAKWASGWEGAPNENPDDLRARRADLFRQQMTADLAPGWHEPQASDMIGSTFTQDGDTRSFTAPAFGGSGSATNVPKLPSAPTSADQPIVDAEKPIVDGITQKDAKDNGELLKKIGL